MGMSGRMIDVRIRNRRLLPVGARTGVYAVGRPIESRRAACMAATLVAGEGSMVSGRAAADLWDFREHKGEIDVVRTHSRKPQTLWLDGEGVVGRYKIVIHRSRHLPGADRTRRHGIPVMNVARLFVDLSARLGGKPLYDAFKAADMKGCLNEKDLFRCAGLGRGWKGIKRFRKLVRRRHPDMKDARTHVEGLVLDICRNDDLGRPVVNRRKGRYYPDFFFEESGLLVEVEGAETHAGRLAFLDDTRRENHLREEVRQLIRFSSEEVINEPDRVGRLIKREQAKCMLLKRLEMPAA
jgi:very-short-patch-repair endonuclease